MMPLSYTDVSGAHGLPPQPHQAPINHQHLIQSHLMEHHFHSAIHHITSQSSDLDHSCDLAITT
jgi:hypothetical protein